MLDDLAKSSKGQMGDDGCDVSIRQVYRFHLPGRFKLYYTLDFPPANWQQKTGFITADMSSRHFLPQTW